MPSATVDLGVGVGVGAAVGSAAGAAAGAAGTTGEFQAGSTQRAGGGSAGLQPSDVNPSASPEEKMEEEDIIDTKKI